jgi:diacylglycerol kinase
MRDDAHVHPVSAEPSGLVSQVAPSLSEFLLDSEPEPEWARRGERQTFRGKFAAGLRGIRRAVRGDSSFFAHAYRGLLIALTASLLRVSPLGWCLLVISGAFVLIAEMAYSAIDTLIRTMGDPDEPGLRAAREIATGGVVIAAIISGALTIAILLIRLGYLLGWWDLTLK